MNSAIDHASRALQAPHVSREALLRYVVLGIESGLLDATVPREEPSSPKVRLASLFCRWAYLQRSTASPGEHPPELVAQSLRLVKLANKIGHPQLASIVIDRMHDIFSHRAPMLYEDMWFELELQAAKSQRLIGAHREAVRTYQGLLERAGNASPHYVPKILLNLGKMSHSYEWRTGLYLQLAKIAEARFRTLLKGNEIDPEELKRQIAICMDCRCQTELSIDDGSGANAIFVRWAEALSLCPQTSSGSSYSRIWLRRTFARFRHAALEERPSILAEYRVVLTQTENDLNEQRGLAVRYGQYAEMLSEVGRIAEAVEYLQAAIDNSRSISDWRVLAGNAIRSSAMQLRFKVSASGDEFATLVTALDRLRKSTSEPPIDVEVALLRQLARHHSAHGDALQAKDRLEEVVEKLEAFERRILAEATNAAYTEDAPSIRHILAMVLDAEEQASIREAGMVDYTILSRFERSVISELLDTINSDVRHQGSKQKVNLSRLAVSTVLHDHKSRVDRLLSELQGRYLQEFAHDKAVRDRILPHLAQAVERVQADFNCGLESFAPRSERAHAISIAEAFAIALDRGRFRTRYPSIDFQAPTATSENFEIAIDADLLITVLDSLLQNAATAVSSYAVVERQVRYSWDWKGNSERLNAMAYIHVEDTGGALDHLREGLAHGRSGRYGLQLAKIFFVDALRGEMQASGTPGFLTKLTIALGASQIVSRGAAHEL